MSERGEQGAYWRRYFDDAAAADVADHERVGYTSGAFAQMTYATVRRLLGPMRGRLVLDAGCGDGQVLAPLAAANVLVGMDFSPAMAGRAGGRGLVPVCGDLTRLPFRPAAFDDVVCAESLQCLTSPADGVIALAALVRPGGRLLVSGLNRRSVLRHLARTYGKLTGRVEPVLMDAAHLTAILGEAGFDVEPVVWVGYVPAFVAQPRSRLLRALLGWPATNFILIARRLGRDA